MTAYPITRPGRDEPNEGRPSAGFARAGRQLRLDLQGFAAGPQELVDDGVFDEFELFPRPAISVQIAF
jgi:hypothetical protein